MFAPSASLPRVADGGDAHGNGTPGRLPLPRGILCVLLACTTLIMVRMHRGTL